jgi:hypothetical protein
MGVPALVSSPWWKRHTAVWACLCVWAAMDLRAAASAQAHASSVPALKAAFLFNFAKFTEWPADGLAPGQRLSLCVIGDTSVADALSQTIDGRNIERHELTVQLIKLDGPVRSCHLLYTGGLDAQRLAQLFRTLAGAAVFTVGDGERFAESGGVTQLILEGDRVRFAVNVEAARRARLTLSSKLLGLAKIVKEDDHAQR